MANITLDYTDFFRDMKNVTDSWTKALQRNMELSTLEEIRQASRRNFRNRTGRLWRSQRRIPGRGARIGSHTAFYWQYIDNFTRGRGRFVTELLASQEVRDRIVQRAIERTERDTGISVS